MLLTAHCWTCRGGPAATGGANGNADLRGTSDIAERFSRYVSSLPDLRLLPADASHELLVDYVFDSSLPGMQPAEVPAFLRETEKQAREYFGVRIQLRLREVHAIDDFFADRSKAFADPVLGWPARSWHIPTDAKDFKPRVEAAVYSAIEGRKASLLEQYFGKARGTPRQYAERISREFTSRLLAICSEPDLSGRPLAKGCKGKRETQMSFAHWDSILYQERQVDFLLTNTILAAADSGMPVYVINRGGVTSGFVENNAVRPYQGVGLLATYPFYSNGPFFRRVRGHVSPELAREIAMFLFLHELGHLLLRIPENYELDGSIHRAPKDLDYPNWLRLVKRHHKRLALPEGRLKKY